MEFYSPTIVCLRKFIWSFTSLGDLESAYEALQQMVSVAFKNRSLVKISSGGRFQSSNLDIPIPLQKELRSNIRIEGSADKNDKEINGHGSVDLLVDVMMERRFEGLGTESTRFQAHTSPAGKKKSSSDCGHIEKKIKHRGLNSSINQCVPATAMKILRWSFNDVIHACAHSQNHELAELLFQQMQSFGFAPSQHTYDGLVKAAVQVNGASYGLDVDQPERAIRVLAKMRRLNIKLDVLTYELLFSLFGAVNAPYEYGNMISQANAKKRILAIEKDMEDHGVLHTRPSFENLLRALGAEGIIDELIMYLKFAESVFRLTDRINMYNIALHALVEGKQSQRALKIFKNMKLCGLSPNATTYNIMIDCCSRLRCFKSAFAFVSMMLQEGFSADTLTYTALLKMLVSFRDFDAALGLLDEALSMGVQPDVLMFNTVLEKASFKWRIDVVESIIKRMHQERIQPDPSTCSQAFYAYVKQGFISTGIEALQVLSLRMIPLDESYIADQKANMEDLVLGEDLDSERRIVDLFKNSQEHFAAALLNLRWCAMSGYSICWAPSRSMWAKSLDIC